MAILSNGVNLPDIGFGVFRAEAGDQAKNAVLAALAAGYRHIDTAYAYYNEDSVGEAMIESGLKREEIFLTTKLWNGKIREGVTREAFEESLKNLKTDYVDLFLIHWPAEGYQKAWAVMEELYKEGKIKAIGVSNFQKHHLDTLAETATMKPMVNQIESNPYFLNTEMVEYCQKEGIVVEAWSPLGGGNSAANILGEETLVSIGEKYGKSPAQVIIRWHLQRGIVVLPKSTTPSRIVQNFEVMDFELTTEEMEQINALDKNTRSGADPDTFTF